VSIIMTNIQSRTLPGQFHLLSRAFEQATRGLSDAENIPSIKACLADKVLAVVASGESDPGRLSKAALSTMRACLLDCTGCRYGYSACDLAN
jgi:hypothetical protein